MKVLDADELAKKFERWRPRYVTAVNTAAQENRLTAKRKKEIIDKLKAEVDRAGEDVAAFAKGMLFLDHIDDAMNVRSDMIEAEDTDKLMAFDRQMTAYGAGLPLFDAATVKEMKANAKLAAEAMVEPEAEPDEPEGDSGEGSKLKVVGGADTVQ